MALEIDFPDNTDDTCENAYLVIEPRLSNINKMGFIELVIWRSKTHREKKKNCINRVNIPVYDKEEINSETGAVLSLANSDVSWLSGEDMYAKIKSLKIKVDDEIIDLSTSKDI